MIDKIIVENTIKFTDKFKPKLIAEIKNLTNSLDTKHVDKFKKISGKVKKVR